MGSAVLGGWAVVFSSDFSYPASIWGPTTGLFRHYFVDRADKGMIYSIKSFDTTGINTPGAYLHPRAPLERHSAVYALPDSSCALIPRPDQYIPD